MVKANKLASKSPAEFFAENQNIAGFDNPGKSLYTSIREFVENSLDAAEACHALPEVPVQPSHNITPVPTFYASCHIFK